MAGNQKQKKKKNSKPAPKPAATSAPKKRRSTSQIVFIAFGVLIILSMLIGLVTNYSF